MTGRLVRRSRDGAMRPRSSISRKMAGRLQFEAGDVSPRREREANHLRATQNDSNKADREDPRRQLMERDAGEEELLRSVALQNAKSILQVRQKAEQELVTAKEALEEANQRITTILECIADGFAVLDRDWRIVYINQVAQAVLRSVRDSAGDHPGKSFWKEFPYLAGTVLEENFRRAVAEQRTAEFELSLPDGGGWLEVRALPGNDQLSVYLHDITLRKTAEETLRDSDERLRATFNQAAVGIAVADLAGRFEELNQKFCDIVGYPADELRQMTFTDLTHPDDLAQTRKNVQSLLSGEIAEYIQEKRYLRKDGGHVISLTTVTVLSDADHRPRRFIGVIEDITQRKQAEEAIKESAYRLQLALDAGHLADWSWVAATDQLRLGPKGIKIFGLPSAEPVTRARMRELLHPDDRERARIALDRALAERGDYDIEYRVNRQHGEGWVAAKGRGVYADDGTVLGMIGVMQEITERKRSDEILRRSEEDLRALADSIPQLAFMAEPNGSIFWYNRGWYAYTGKDFAQMQDGGWESVHDPQMLPLVTARWRESVQNGEPFEMEFPLRGADGVFRWFLTRVNPVRDDQGRVSRWFGTNTDVDQVKQVQEALRDETRILELLNKTGTTLAAKLDLQSLVQSLTDAATELSGAKFGAFFYNLRAENGDAFMLYVLAGIPREAFEKFGMPRATPLFGPIFRGESPIRCDDVLTDPRYGQLSPHHGMPEGHPRVRSFLAVPVRSRTSEVIGGLFFGHPDPGIFTDRTERLIVGVAAQAAVAIDNARLYDAAQKAAAERERLLESERLARQEAERMSEMKDDFLATVSHELRSPLSAILGWSHVLKRNAGSEADLKKGLDTIERNARAQTQLIEDLLDMSRITSGKVRLDMQPVEPASFIEAAVETIRPAAEAKGIAVEMTLDPAVGTIAGDPNRLQQVIGNLLSNAIKFTPKGGQVRIALQRVQSDVEISVADTGTGIKPEFLAHVFERFRQADASTTRRYGGLGLGLAIVRHLVELHGGSVRAMSPGEGQGATFSLRLPVTALPSKQFTDPRPHHDPANAVALPFKAVDLAGIRVLIVDDDADVRELIRRVLTDCEASVWTAGTAIEALTIVETQRPHVLVSDIGMPDVDGFELLRRVRSLGQTGGGKLPAIALTAFARSEDRTRALRAGFLAHVAKPVEPSELVATVASVAGRSDEGR